MKLVVALCLCLVLAAHGLRKQSLSHSGAVAAMAVGLVIFTNPLNLFSFVLLVFYLAGSQVTKVQSDKKKKLEDFHVDGGQRDAYQVLCNGLNGALLALFHRFVRGDVCGMSANQTMIIMAFVAHFGCCAGDTFASELGILSKSRPFLLTTMRRVPPGTNGAVSVMGTAASLLGGVLVGLTAALSVYLQCGSSEMSLSLVVCGALSGVLGSLIDSILGATLQPTFYNPDKKQVTNSKNKTKHISGLNLLSNNQVNYISATIVAALVPLMLNGGYLGIW